MLLDQNVTLSAVAERVMCVWRTDSASKTTRETILSGVSFLLYTKSKLGGALVERPCGRAATAVVTFLITAVNNLRV